MLAGKIEVCLGLDREGMGWAELSLQPRGHLLVLGDGLGSVTEGVVAVGEVAADGEGVRVLGSKRPLVVGGHLLKDRQRLIRPPLRQDGGGEVGP